MKKTVTRSQLASVIYEKYGYSRAESADLVDSVLEEVKLGLKEDKKVKISSFGTFEVRKKKQRMGRNPRTKQEVMISARNVVSFYASNMVKKLINS